MAYPIGSPTMLMMLTSPDVPDSKSTFTSVERDRKGALRFELVGDDPGTWLEWHPPGSAPSSFTGGLENSYALERNTALGKNWYLARYKRGLNLPTSTDAATETTAPKGHALGPKHSTLSPPRQ
jgi:hypothetical protein